MSLLVFSEAHVFNKSNVCMFYLFIKNTNQFNELNTECLTVIYNHIISTSLNELHFYVNNKIH